MAAKVTKKAAKGSKVSAKSRKSGTKAATKRTKPEAKSTKAAPKADPNRGKRDKNGLTRKDRVFRALVANRELTAKEAMETVSGADTLSINVVRRWISRWRKQMEAGGKPCLTWGDPDKVVDAFPKASRDVFSKPKSRKSGGRRSRAA